MTDPTLSDRLLATAKAVGAILAEPGSDVANTPEEATARSVLANVRGLLQEAGDAIAKQASAPKGRVVTVGRITTCENYPQEFADDLNYETTSGLLVEMSDDDLRAAASLYGQTAVIGTLT